MNSNLLAAQRRPAEETESQGPRRQSLAASRLRRHADFQRAYSASRKRQSASMSWFMAPRTEGGGVAGNARVGLTAGKVLGKAPERNRIKRRMREALRRHVELLPAGFDLIFHPRRSVLTLDFGKLEAEIVRILEQARSEAARIAAAGPDSEAPPPPAKGLRTKGRGSAEVSLKHA